MTTAAICATQEVSWGPSSCRGEQYDSDLGLYYLRARYYNPATARFMSRDPLDGKTWEPNTLHKYLYAGGDPVNASDPSGRGILDTGAIDYDFILEAAPKVVLAGIAAAKLFCWTEAVLASLLTHAGIPTQQPQPEADLCLLLGP